MNSFQRVFIEYFKTKDCGVMKVGENLDSKMYGLATQNGSPLTYISNYNYYYLNSKTYK